MTNPFRSLQLLAVLILFSLPAQAQEGPSTSGVAIPEPAVRYDDDLLPASFHRERREELKAALPEDAVAIVFSNPVRVRENGVEYLYRQSSYLYYLTGTHEPASVLVLAPGGIEVGGRSVRELLFVPPRDPMHEVWEGRLFGPARAQRELGMEKAVSNGRFEEILYPVFANNGHRVHHLPLPQGIVAGSQLDRQVSFFLDHVPSLPSVRDATLQQVVAAMLTVESEQQFQQLKAFIRNMVDPEAFTEPILREAYAALAESPSLDGWNQWRETRLSEMADGTTLKYLLDEMRTTKTGEEIGLLRRAIDITVLAHRLVMKSIRPGMHEYEVAAIAEYIFQRNGAYYPAFPTIVASGENSVILHYSTRRRQMQDGDLVVIDMGAEYHGYAADVTRTIPVNGRFSPEQRAIYEIVLEAQEAGIAAARAGASFHAPDNAARPIVARRLMELGLIDSEQEVGRFFMHGTSHHLGLNVHDPIGTLGLDPGAVITVEPGVYIAPAEDIDEKWWNIGVRIEDDILVTGEGPVNLSAGAPRTVEEIEALMAESGIGDDLQVLLD